MAYDSFASLSSHSNDDLKVGGDHKVVADSHGQYSNASMGKRKRKQFEDKQVVKQELTGQDLLQAMYKAHEKESQRRKQNRIKVKLKVGSAVDVYSASRKKWTPGVVNEIQGDALCLLYANGKKKKWVKKDSSTFRPKI
eukprot:25391_1